MKNRICEILGIEKPIIQGPMNWLTDGKFVATGFDEGGTVPNKVVGTFSVVPMIVDAAKGRVPAVACGGIADEFVAVGVTTLKHCLRFLSRLANGIDNLQCGKVNPARKMIDPKKARKRGHFHIQASFSARA